VLVRTDMPLADQMVQVGHACLAAGRQFEQPEQPCQLGLLSVSSEKQLQMVVEQAELRGVCCAIFDEPDDNLGWTAACTEPINGLSRRVFRRFPLWRPAETNPYGRGPPGCVQTQRIS
jgi:hypothetical protein